MENIPEVLFDLLEQKQFNELTIQEKELVLKYMDAATYASLCQTAKLSKQFLQTETSPEVPSKQLELLLKKAEIQQLREPAIVWNKPVAMWKVAALFLLLGGGWLVFVLANNNKEVSTSYITQLDTVFVEKEIPGEKIHDTVFIEYKRKQRKNTRYEEQLPSEAYSSVRETVIPAMNDVNIVQVKEKDEPINNKKGNSIKDDSLINAFGFVTL